MRLTGAFLVVVLGPVLVGGIVVGASVSLSTTRLSEILWLTTASPPRLTADAELRLLDVSEAGGAIAARARAPKNARGGASGGPQPPRPPRGR